MTQKELAEMYGIKPRRVGLRDKKKAIEICTKILKCHKCGESMHWVEGTNICVCPTCTYSTGKKESKKVFSVYKTISEKSKKFLTENYDTFIKASTKKEESEAE